MTTWYELKLEFTDYEINNIQRILFAYGLRWKQSDDHAKTISYLRALFESYGFKDPTEWYIYISEHGFMLQYFMKFEDTLMNNSSNICHKVKLKKPLQEFTDDDILAITLGLCPYEPDDTR